MSDISFNFEPTGINELIRSACEEYSCDEHSDIKLFLSDDDIILNLDHTQMRRVIRNIIDNSIKYRRADKCLIEIKTEYTNDGAVISVTDDGIGVDIDDTSRLFESFYRADPSRTPNITGSGLGLAIAKEIVEKHGGKIRLKNAQPHGVTVYIFLKGN
ncbi:MAG: HAMP domain-containing histidine kinase, partial [Oscillospiraceae bacterium]|nr:HAMP domain-containing histidine kinase [Oscillospiraceae bacterium]